MPTREPRYLETIAEIAGERKQVPWSDNMTCKEKLKLSGPSV